ncbi:aldo/keto reductase [Mycolicibacterium komossense]|uniref:Aldo/keto reductase n=1 Tax=Mycolicibacterium komossense TaxID=1779 RepID=A0ABT3CGM5_9MYCO|nr:aldo/keto reductase [Mycolicibacterium komossense]MCV7228645.1 aldo/keto reductase [Mycolicibacterium komossense]
MTSIGQSGATVPSIGLNDDNTMPVLGLGVGELSDAETEHAVSTALEIGYRLIDTAAAYGNEAAVGRAIAASGIPRAEVFVTTKLDTPNQGFGQSQDALKASLDRLGMEYVDLYLIHWPAPGKNMYIDSFGGMMRSREDGLARSIGVCNFHPEHLQTLIELAFSLPAVNQVELHPLLNQAQVRAYNTEQNVVTEAYSPLGVGAVLENATVQSIAGSYGKTAAQVLIRWSLQLGNVVIPRSKSAERIAENFDVFDFELRTEDMDALNGLDDGTRFREDPDTFNG